jgi:hypothetical protein
VIQSTSYVGQYRAQMIDEYGTVVALRIGRESEVLGENLFQCPSLHYELYVRVLLYCVVLLNSVALSFLSVLG